MIFAILIPFILTSVTPDWEAHELLHITLNDRVLMWELGVGMYLLLCGVYDIFFGKNQFYIFLFLQAITFFIVGFGYVGTYVPS